MSDNYEDMNIDQLAGLLSDYHKDVFGNRKYLSNTATSEDYIDELRGIDAYVDSLQSTFEGREALRDEGWILHPETDPELIIKAKASQEQRERNQALQDEADTFGTLS